MPCSALVAQARRSPGETHGAQCATPRSVGQLLAAPPTPDSARGRIRPAEHDGSVISAHRRAADQGVKDLLCCACSTPALALQTHMLGSLPERALQRAQMCCDAYFLAQPGLCMQISRAHYSAVFCGRNGHLFLSIRPCTPSPCLVSFSQMSGTVDTNVLCTSYFCTDRTI